MRHDDDSRPPVVAIVGLGLIGGSLARALVAQGTRVIGTTADPDDRERAARAGVVVTDDLAALVTQIPPDATVVLAVPLSALGAVADMLVPGLAAGVVVLHAAGLQREAATSCSAAAQARVIGTHPLAGSHEAGFAASRPDLFAGATVWAESRADAATRTRLEWLWRSVGVKSVSYATAEEHDTHMAWASHLPQLAATALGATLAGAGIPATVGGPGLRDATRLAASPFPLWRDVLAAAPADTAAALAALACRIDQLGTAVATRDPQALETLWARAHEWRTTSLMSNHSTPQVHTVRAIRGAISVEADEPAAVHAATRELLTAIVERNAIAFDDLVSAVFTVTADLTSAFPARAACEMGWTDVPLLCAMEIPVPGALPRCIRVLLHVASERPRSAIEHVYLGRAVTLRPDLVGNRAALDA